MQVYIVTKVVCGDCVLEDSSLKKPTVFFNLSDATTEMYRRAYHSVFRVDADSSKTNDELIEEISKSPNIRQVRYGRHILKLKPVNDYERYTIFTVLDLDCV